MIIANLEEAHRVRSPTAAAAALLLAVVALAPPAAAQAVSPTGDDVARAVRLYDEGRYDEARPILAAIEADGRANGSLLYRLYYCLLRDRAPAARDMLARALASLESELDDAADFEVPFYLANAYINSARRPDATRVAAATVERVESGSLAEPTDPVEMFRLGKLYADLERDDEAARWYAAALDGFTSDPQGAPRPYIEWAATWLGERAGRTGDDRALVRAYSTLLEDGEGTLDDWDRLATAHARLGEWKPAAAAWRKAERANPAEANRPRYCYRLADMAATLELPEALPDGRAIADLDPAAMQEAMSEQVRALAEVHREAAEATTWKKRQRRKLERRVEEIKATFVAVAMRYAIGRHGIREAAFFGGYAPLIFRPREWNLPQPGTAGEDDGDAESSG